jgi:hypothetical protein
MNETPTVAALPDLESMMGEFVRDNPQLAWLPQLMAAQRRSAAAEVPSAQPSELDELQQALAQADARAAKLQRINRRLAADLDAAQGLLSDLAAAFGACGLCWGEDPGCPSCRGRGKPGRFAADAELAQRFGATPSEAVAPRVSVSSPQPGFAERS